MQRFPGTLLPPAASVPCSGDPVPLPTPPPPEVCSGVSSAASSCPHRTPTGTSWSHVDLPARLPLPACLEVSACWLPVQIWDFRQCRTERVLTGHGGDVKSCDWHPSKALVASGSKDAQVKLWDVKAGKSISTLMGHHGTVSQVVWNKNGNWLLTASRDQSLKVGRLAVSALQRVLGCVPGHVEL